MTILSFPASSDDRIDRLLIERIADRDAAAMEELHRRLYTRLYRYVLRITHRRELVEEVVNDVMFAVWRGADRFQGRSKVSSWILGIAYRQALKALSRERRGPQTVEESRTGREPAGEDRKLTNTVLELLLAKALGSLSPEHRAVVELTYYDGYSYPEIAQILDCPTNTVKTRMFHARRRLRTILASHGVHRLDGALENSP